MVGDPRTLSKPRSIALVSGGLDSLVSLARAVVERDVRAVMFFDYGQRARDSERASSMMWPIYGLSFLDADVRLESLAPAGMRPRARISRASRHPGRRLIPNRNGVFINVAAAYAESYGCDTIVTGQSRRSREFPTTRRLRRAR
jgi:7-cyano-7-deazaguanine synthase